MPGEYRLADTWLCYHQRIYLSLIKDIGGYKWIVYSLGLTVITKDIDFRNAHFIKQTPRRIIRICLGNISNQDLISLLKKHWQVIEKMHQKYDRFYCEINKEDISLIV